MVERTTGRIAFEGVLKRLEEEGQNLESVIFKTFVRWGDGSPVKLGVTPEWVDRRSEGQGIEPEVSTDSRNFVLDALQNGIHIVPENIQLVTTAHGLPAYFFDLDLRKKTMACKYYSDGNSEAQYRKYAKIFEEAGWNVEVKPMGSGRGLFV